MRNAKACGAWAWRIAASVLLPFLVVLPVMASSSVHNLVALPPSGSSLLAAACSPRPPVDVLATKPGESDFRLRLTAGRATLSLIRFGNPPAPRLDLPDGRTGLTPLL